MTVLLTVEELTVVAADAILRPTSLTLRAGRALTILGETGSGKSLLAQAIMGVLPEGLSASGRVLLDGRDLMAAPRAERRALWGRVIGLLPQEPWRALDPTMRAGAQVDETHRLVAGLPAPAADATARADLLQLGLPDAVGKLPGELSGGMAQRVAFAAARAGRPRILIADEPTKGLDADRRDDVVALLRREIDEGGGLLTITHDVAVARQLGGDVAIMRGGEVLEQGPSEEVLRAPQSEYGRSLLAAEPDRWPVRTLGRVGDPVLRAEGLAKTRGGKLLFRGLDLEIGAGEIVGIRGPSGCGKSTLGSLLLGLVAPDEGRVWRRNAATGKHRYQKLYQDPPAAFPPHVTLRQALHDLMRLHRLDWGAVDILMERLRLSGDLLDRRPHEVSGGELQRLALLRVLLLDPVFLFADEPTSRLDLLTQRETVMLLTDVAQERGCSVLLVSHDRDLLEKVTHRSITLT